jgi:hypothetical protein
MPPELKIMRAGSITMADGSTLATAAMAVVWLAGLGAVLGAVVVAWRRASGRRVGR